MDGITVVFDIIMVMIYNSLFFFRFVLKCCDDGVAGIQIFSL